MNEGSQGQPEPEPETQGQPERPFPPVDQDAWKTVYFGQLSRDLVPYHPDPPEAPEDELTRMALSDPDSVTRADAGPEGAPTFWRLLTVLALAVGSLALVFWRRR